MVTVELVLNLESRSNQQIVESGIEKQLLSIVTVEHVVFSRNQVMNRKFASMTMVSFS